MKARMIPCMAVGCAVNLADEGRPYNIKRRCCCLHIKADVFNKEGTTGFWRFCFQCGRAQPLSDFDGSKRTCREQLRRRRLTASSASQAPGTAVAAAEDAATSQVQPPTYSDFEQTCVSELLSFDSHAQLQMPCSQLQHAGGQPAHIATGRISSCDEGGSAQLDALTDSSVPLTLQPSTDDESSRMGFAECEWLAALEDELAAAATTAKAECTRSAVQCLASQRHSGCVADPTLAAAGMAAGPGLPCCALGSDCSQQMHQQQCMADEIEQLVIAALELPSSMDSLSGISDRADVIAEQWMQQWTQPQQRQSCAAPDAMPAVAALPSPMTAWAMPAAAGTMSATSDSFTFEAVHVSPASISPRAILQAQGLHMQTQINAGATVGPPQVCAALAGAAPAAMFPGVQAAQRPATHMRCLRLQQQQQQVMALLNEACRLVNCAVSLHSACAPLP